MKRSWLVPVLVFAVASAQFAPAARADVLTSERLAEVGWGTRSMRLLLPDLLLKLDRLGHAAVANTAALTAIAPAARYGGMQCVVLSAAGGVPRTFIFHAASAAAPVADLIYQPDTGTGRWYRSDYATAGTGDIDGVTAGTGLSGGGTSGTVTLNVNPASMQTRVTGTCAAGSSVASISETGTVTCETDTDTTYTAGDGLQLVGTEFEAKIDNTTITQVAGTLRVGSLVVQTSGATLTGTLSQASGTATAATTRGAVTYTRVGGSTGTILLSSQSTRTGTLHIEITVTGGADGACRFQWKFGSEALNGADLNCAVAGTAIAPGLSVAFANNGGPTYFEDGDDYTSEISLAGTINAQSGILTVNLSTPVGAIDTVTLNNSEVTESSVVPAVTCQYGTATTGVPIVAPGWAVGAATLTLPIVNFADAGALNGTVKCHFSIARK